MQKKVQYVQFYAILSGTHHAIETMIVLNMELLP